MPLLRSQSTPPRELRSPAGTCHIPGDSGGIPEGAGITRGPDGLLGYLSRSGPGHAMVVVVVELVDIPIGTQVADSERYSKPASERRPSGPERAVGAGDAVSNHSGSFE
jgi:hypothetical protein